MENENSSPAVEKVPDGFSPPEPDDGGKRIRPTIRPPIVWLLFAVLVGAVPALAVSYWFWHQVQAIENQYRQSLQNLSQYIEQERRSIKILQENIDAFAENLQQLAERNRQLEQRLLHERLRERILLSLKGKTAQEVTEETQIPKQLERFPEIEALVFLDSDGRPLRTVPEGLLTDSKFGEELRQALSSPHEREWFFAGIPESPIRIACKMRIQPVPTLPQVASSFPEGQLAELPAHDNQLQHLEKTTKLLTVVAPIAGLLLALGLFLGLRRHWWLPLKKLTYQAELLLEGQPLSGEKYVGAGEGLATSLARIQQRLERLTQLERWREQTTKEALLLEETVKQASALGPSVRMPHLEGDLVPLSQAIGRLLESWESRLQGLAFIASRLQSCAENLNRIAEDLAVQLPEEKPVADQQTICQLLTVSLETIYQTLQTLAGKDLPEAVTSSSDIQNVKATAVLLEELSGMFDELETRAVQLRETEALLSTKLTLDERGSQDTLRLAESLRHDMENLFSDLRIKVAHLRQATRTNRQQLEIMLEEKARLLCSHNQILEDFKKLKEKINGQLEQLRVIQPLSRNLADTFANLFELIEKRSQQLDKIKRSLEKLSETVAQISELGRIAARDIEQLVGRSVHPATFSREIANSHSALQRALRYLEESLRRNHLQTMEPQIEQLLEQIQSAAQTARARIRSGENQSPSHIGS